MFTAPAALGGVKDPLQPVINCSFVDLPEGLRTRPAVQPQSRQPALDIVVPIRPYLSQETAGKGHRFWATFDPTPQGARLIGEHSHHRRPEVVLEMSVILVVGVAQETSDRFRVHDVSGRRGQGMLVLFLVKNPTDGAAAKNVPASHQSPIPLRDLVTHQARPYDQQGG